MVISFGCSCSSSGGGSGDGNIELQDKIVVINKNNTSTTITSDGGYVGLNEVKVMTDIPMETKNIEITENADITITPSEDYDGLGEVNISVNVPDTNGSYDEGYSDGITQGIEEQKAKLTSISITENGTYNREDGYNEVTVNVEIPEKDEQKELLMAAYNGDYITSVENGINYLVRAKIIPFLYNPNDGTYKPFNRQTYNVDNAEFQYTLNNDGEVANFTSNWHFENNILPLIIDKTYSYVLTYYDNDWKYLIIRDGDLLSPLGGKASLGSYYPNPVYYYNYGFKDEYGDYKTPSSLLYRAGDGYTRLMETKYYTIYVVEYTDNLITDSHNIYANIGCNRTKLAYSANLSNHSAYLDAFLYTGEEPLNIWGSNSRYELGGVYFLNPNVSFADIVVNSSSTIYNKYFCKKIKCNWRRIGDYPSIIDMRDNKLIEDLEITDVEDAYPNNKIEFNFYECSNLKSINFISNKKMGQGQTDMGQMFRGCTSLTSISQLDTSNTTSMRNMFYNCSSLTYIPELITSNVTVMYYMFYNCSSLTYIPELITSNVTDMQSMFSGCTSLTTIPELITSNVTLMGSMFSGCTSLTSIPELDCSSVTSTSAPFGYYTLSKLTDLGGFKNLKVSWSSNFLDKVPNATYQSLLNVINGLYDFVGNGETGGKTVKFGTTNLAKLTDDDIAIATNKGWTLS